MTSSRNFYVNVGNDSKVKPHSFLGRFLRLPAEVDDSFSYGMNIHDSREAQSSFLSRDNDSLRPGLEPCASRSSPLFDHDDHEIIVDITLGFS